MPLLDTSPWTFFPIRARGYISLFVLHFICSGDFPCKKEVEDANAVFCESGALSVERQDRGAESFDFFFENCLRMGNTDLLFL